MKSRKAVITITLLAAAAVALTSCLSGCAPKRTDDGAASASAAKAEKATEHVPEEECRTVPEVDAETAASLPWADSSAVIPGLEKLPEKLEPWSEVSVVKGDHALLYARTDDGDFRPAGWVSRGQAWAPEDKQPIVVLSDPDCGWVQVMTPASAAKPSVGSAGAYAGWMRSADLGEGWKVAAPVRVGLSEGTLTIPGVEVFPTVLGGEGTPTTTAMGYFVGSYTDAAQPFTGGEPISLTNIHGPTSYSQNAGELGIHFATSPGGSSHGCVRLPESREHARAVAALPAGTPIIIEQ
ncbi:L,D-transpeptidase [Paramicrobacterium agarici]|uniref:L,D-transpeptidase n=1 Tax=Paramicrobacterium agarici TaxID=630514 RepID=UPI001153648B|nr:L,D-transpeptidase [Microbacterium agarici]TQO24253.1 hypothetical protein FB385_3133 [Microbacterium agarici]